MSICILKGFNTEAIDSTLYPSIKQCYLEFIDALVEKGFLRETIKIKFDDENRQIHFDYYPDEIDALMIYVDFEDKLQCNVTQSSFSEGWPGARYSLWHNKTETDYLLEIKSLCALYSELSEQRNCLPAKWYFSQQNHAYLSPPERKTAVKNALVELRENNISQQGIFLNEIHHHAFPKKFLAENLEYFKSLGIKTLFFEFLLYERHQQLLDQYFVSDTDELPPELAAYLNAKDLASNCGFSGYTDIVKSARKAGIRIVALDSYPSILSVTGSFKRALENDSTVRLKSFNGYAAEIIKKECHDEPYLVFLGFEHGYSHGNSRYKNIRSVVELLPDTCSIFLTDSPVSYGNCYPPFFSGVKPVVFRYSSIDSEAGADIVESSWRGMSSRL